MSPACAEVVVHVSGIDPPYTVRCFGTGVPSPFMAYITPDATSAQCIWGVWGSGALHVEVNGVPSNSL